MPVNTIKYPKHRLLPSCGRLFYHFILRRQRDLMSWSVVFGCNGRLSKSFDGYVVVFIGKTFDNNVSCLVTVFVRNICDGW